MAAVDQLAAVASATRQELGRRRLIDFADQVVPGFERAAHVTLLAEHLEAVEAGEIRRLAVMAPPRHGKSTTAARALPAWWLGRRPHEHVILASYGAELAEGHSRAARGYVTGAAWPFPDVQVSRDSAAVGRWATTAGGGVRAVGVGSGVTGHGGHLIVADDLLRGAADADSATVRDAVWRWWTDDLLTRLEPEGAVVLVGTRWHADDPIGRVLDGPGASDWTVVSLPAVAEEDDLLGRDPGAPLWPGRFGSEHYASQREALGPRGWAALYQQRPALAEGAVFAAGWMAGRYETVPDGCTVVTAVDASFGKGLSSGDYSALVTVATDGRFFYVLDARRGRWQFHQLTRAIEQVAADLGPSHVLIEDSAAGQSAVQELRRTTSLPVVAVPAKLSKVARADAVTGLFEAGRVLFPAAAPGWRHDLLDELGSFPHGKHDDLVDAIVHALARLRGKRSGVGRSILIEEDRDGTVRVNGEGPASRSADLRRTLRDGSASDADLAEAERLARLREPGYADPRFG